MQQSGFWKWRNWRVSTKLLFISLGYQAIIWLIVGLTVVANRQDLHDNEVIDLAGRQRMLSERYVKELLMTQQGMTGDYRATLKLFDDTLEALANGGPAVIDLATGRTITLNRNEVPDIEPLVAQQKQLSAQIKADTQALLELKPTDPQRLDKLRQVQQTASALTTEAARLVRRLSEGADEKIALVIRAEWALSLAALLLGGLTAWAVARWIARPLGLCADMAQRIAAGDLNLQKLPVLSSDETGKLAMSFDDMLESLRDIAIQSRAVTENLNSAAAEILATTQQQASATKEQAAAVQQITSTVEEISQSSAQVSDRAKVVATAAQSMAVQGSGGLESVRHTSRAMDLIREQAESVAENVVALSEKTQAIGEIIATVNDIAEQSNLVALNAAIEAADAREDGRRFAVVANEIKNLADQAKEATGQVRSILEEIQKGINTSVMLTEEAVKRVEAGREKTQMAEQTIRKMADNIQDNVSAFQQIVSATNQQQIGLEQVTHALHEIRSASTQTASSTRQLEEAAGNVTTLAVQLRKVMEKYRL
jgi:methyl-accepting chemotaxis protein